MRAKEFINESSDGLRGQGRAKAPSEFAAAHTNLVAPAGRGDLYIGRYYDFYRVAALTGMDPEELKKVDAVSFFGNLPAYSGYSDADREKLVRVLKFLGMNPKESIPRGSSEKDDINCVSPIKSFKGYKK